MMYLTIGFGWAATAGLALAACRIAAVGDGDCSSTLGVRRPLRLPLSDHEE